MFKNQLRSLVEHERITTTETKAKVLKRLADKLITVGKKQSFASRRHAHSILRSDELTAKLCDDLAKRFVDRPGGYTRVMKLGRRAGDGAPLSVIEFVDRVAVTVTESSTSKPADTTATE